MIFQVSHSFTSHKTSAASSWQGANRADFTASW
jgi:hypothetical protein